MLAVGCCSIICVIQVTGVAGALGPPAVLLVAMGSVPDRGSVRDVRRNAVCVLLDQHFRLKDVSGSSVLVRLGQKKMDILSPTLYPSSISGS